MPYRARGKWVQIRRNNRWVNMRQAESAGDAQTQASALNINVQHSNPASGVEIRMEPTRQSRPANSVSLRRRGR